MPNYTLSEIAEKLGLRYEGPERKIVGIQTLDAAGETHLSVFHDTKYLQSLKRTKAAAVLVDEAYAASVPENTIALVTPHPYLSLAEASALFAHPVKAHEKSPLFGEDCDIAKSVRFGEGVVIGNRVTIMPGCYLGDGVKVGDDTLIHPNVTLYHGTKIGTRCIIHSGTVIGSDGYGFAHTKEGTHVKIHQNGNVVIEDDVEIGANCTIDRAVFGSTTIKCGTKMDNLIQVAHNCIVGEHSLLAAQVGLAGSTILERNVVMGGQSASAGHLTIGAFATIAGKGGVTKSLEGGKTYAGFPAIEIGVWRKVQAALIRLVKKR